MGIHGTSARVCRGGVGMALRRIGIHVLEKRKRYDGVRECEVVRGSSEETELRGEGLKEKRERELTKRPLYLVNGFGEAEERIKRSSAEHRHNKQPESGQNITATRDDVLALAKPSPGIDFCLEQSNCIQFRPSPCLSMDCSFRQGASLFSNEGGGGCVPSSLLCLSMGMSSSLTNNVDKSNSLIISLKHILLIIFFSVHHTIANLLI